MFTRMHIIAPSNLTLITTLPNRESAAMSMVMFSIVNVPLFIMSLVLLSGRGGSLISGFNALSKENRALYDEKALCRATGAMLLAMIVFLTLIQVGIHYQKTAILWISIVMTVVIPVGFVIYVNTGKRFLLDKNAPKPVFSRTGLMGHNKYNSKTAFLISMIIVAVTLVGVTALIVYGGKEPQVSISENNVSISGIFGKTVEYSDIINIHLIDKSIRDFGSMRRTSGYSAGQVQKGNYSSSELGAIILFVHVNSSPTIWIELIEGRDIYINFPESETTVEIFTDLTEKLSTSR